MRLFGREDKTIRRFLLGQLSEKKRARVEDRIFTDPDFAEEVQIAEQELIADERAGKLTAEERQRFAERYASEANQATLNFESAFSEFVGSKTQNLASVADLRTQSPAPLHRKSSKQRRFWHQLSPTGSPAVVYPTIAAGLVLFIVTLWYAVPYFQQVAFNQQPARETIEAELAQLNSPGTSPASILSTVDLEIAQRYGGGTMARITPRNPQADAVLEFHLNLAEMNNKRYRAVVFDDRRNELFAIPDLTAQDTQAGPRIRLLIPLKYLSRGDYQIDLVAANESGDYDQINSYAFRVVDSR